MITSLIAAFISSQNPGFTSAKSPPLLLAKEIASDLLYLSRILESEYRYSFDITLTSDSIANIETFFRYFKLHSQESPAEVFAQFDKICPDNDRYGAIVMSLYLSSRIKQSAVAKWKEKSAFSGDWRLFSTSSVKKWPWSKQVPATLSFDRMTFQAGTGLNSRYPYTWHITNQEYLRDISD